MTKRVQTYVDAIVDGIFECYDAHIAAMCDSMLAASPTLDERGRELLVPSTRSSLRVVLEQLRSNGSGEGQTMGIDEPDVAAVTRDYVRTLAWSGESVEPFVLAYRAAERSFCQIWADECLRQCVDGADLREVLHVGSSSGLFLLDSMLDQYVNEYVEAAARREADSSAVQWRTVMSILERHDQPVDPTRLSTLLQYSLDSCHVGAVITVSQRQLEASSGPVSRQELEMETAGRLSAVASPNTRPLAVTLPEATWLWCAVMPGHTNALMTQLAETSVPAGVVVGIGEPASGLTGFRQTHGDARAVHDLAEVMPSRPQRPLLYSQHALLAFLAAQPSQARRFVDHMLGDLNRDDDRTAGLRFTLRIFHETAGSYAEVGRRLNVHPHTVRYRIEQADKLIGNNRAAVDPDVLIALRLRDVVGLSGFS